MNKAQFINLIRSQRDTGFLTAIYDAVIETLPKSYADNLVYESYVTRIYEGDVYTLTYLATGSKHYFAGASDVNEFLKNLNAKYTSPNMYRVRNQKGKTLYGYEISYTNSKETSS